MSFPQIQKRYGEKLSSFTFLWLQERYVPLVSLISTLSFYNNSLSAGLPFPGEYSWPQGWLLQVYALHTAPCMPTGTPSQEALRILEIKLYSWSLPLSLGSSISMCSTPSSFLPFSPEAHIRPPGCGALSQQHRQKKHVWRHRRKAGVWAEIYGSSQN